jgi:large subunit ribosomal protein L49
MDADFLGRSDAQALQRDLASYLTDVPSHVKPAAGQIVLRGDWVRETKEWLAAKGF